MLYNNVFAMINTKYKFIIDHAFLYFLDIKYVVVHTHTHRYIDSYTGWIETAHMLVQYFHNIYITYLIKNFLYILFFRDKTTFGNPKENKGTKNSLFNQQILLGEMLFNEHKLCVAYLKDTR